MRVIDNRTYSRRGAIAARLARVARQALTGLLGAWSVAFPMPPSPDDPNAPAPLAKSQALREGARLSEQLDAVSQKRVA